MKTRTPEGLADLVEKARRDLNEHGSDPTRRPELAGEIIRAAQYAARIPDELDSLVLANLRDASSLFTGNATGAVDRVRRSLTAALNLLPSTTGENAHA
jgi:hypothetical protein